MMTPYLYHDPSGICYFWKKINRVTYSTPLYLFQSLITYNISIYQYKSTVFITPLSFLRLLATLILMLKGNKQDLVHTQTHTYIYIYSNQGKN